MLGHHEDANGTVFLDIILLSLMGVLFMVYLIAQYVNPPASMAKEGKEPPGNVIVEAFWPDEINVDVDLWVKAPGDVPVGYSNLSGLIFNLLRDDLGNYRDASKRNFETALARGIIPGEYIVNLHLYRDEPGVYPVEVTVVISVKAEGESSKQILTTAVELTSEGQEITALRFALEANGALVPGSVNRIPRPLRSPGKGAG